MEWYQVVKACIMHNKDISWQKAQLISPGGMWKNGRRNAIGNRSTNTEQNAFNVLKFNNNLLSSLEAIATG